jgi:hypothetical protein
MGHLARIRFTVILAIAQSSDRNLLLMMRDVIAVGELMRDKSGHLIGAMVGIALQTKAIRTAEGVLSGVPIERQSEPTPRT